MVENDECVNIFGQSQQLSFACVIQELGYPQQHLKLAPPEILPEPARNHHTRSKQVNNNVSAFLSHVLYY